MKRHVLVEDQERPLIWIEDGPSLLGVPFTVRRAIAVAIGVPVALAGLWVAIVVYLAVYG